MKDGAPFEASNNIPAAPRVMPSGMEGKGAGDTSGWVRGRSHGVSLAAALPQAGTHGLQILNAREGSRGPGTPVVQ